MSDSSMTSFPTYDVREAICEVGRRAWQKGHVAANDGNFSFRLDANTVLATPTKLSKGVLTPEDLVLIDLDGNQIGGARKMTSEVRLHLNAYRRRPDIRAVVHTHPPHATAFAAAELALPEGVLEETELYLGPVPLVPYLPTGTWEFARGLDPYLAEHDAFLLAHHGAVTLGADPFDAWYKMEVLDHSCRILALAAQLGGWKRLSEHSMRGVLEAKARHGLRDRRAVAAAADGGGAGVSVPWPEKWTPGDWPRVSDEPKLSSPPLG